MNEFQLSLKALDQNPPQKSTGGLVVFLKKINKAIY